MNKEVRRASQVALVVKNPPTNAGDTRDATPGGPEDPLEEEMATHSSILAWEIPRKKEPGGLCPWGCKESDMTKHTHTQSQRRYT